MEFYEQLKTRLDQVHKWPAPYMFKFIVPFEKKEELLTLLPLGQIEQRLSRTGKYVSLSLKAKVSDSEQIISVYKKTSLIEGIVSL